MRRTLQLVTFLGLFAGVSGAVRAAPPVLVFAQEAHLVGGSNTFFGSGLSLDGESCLIGAPNAVAKKGEATVYSRVGGVWSPFKLPNTTSAGAQNFGTSVALAGDLAFVGAPGETSNGAVHVFQRNPADQSWSFTQLIKAPGVSPLAARFGSSMSFDGTTLAVGAPEQSTDGTYAGRVYLFIFDANTSAWVLQSTLSATPVSSRFGSSVSISGDRLVVGATIDTGNAGKAFFFKNNGGVWQANGSFTEPGGAKPNRYFGAAVAVEQDVAFVGATSTPNAGNGAAYRYAFDGNAWSYTGDVYQDGNLYFGASLRLREGKLAIGANGSKLPKIYSASGQSPWPLLASLSGPSGPLGAPVDMSGELIAASTLYGNGFVDIGSLKLDKGSDCALDSECASGFCVDGVCCDKACGAGTCDACSKAAGASADGTCTLLTGPVCDDGSLCTQSDSCVAGVCTGGNPVTCAASDQCHVVGVCDPASGICSNPEKSADSPCDDGNACSLNDTCQGGVCTGGDALSCGDNNVCTADSCDPVLGCQFAPLADDTVCDDGNACNVGDRCLAGECKAVSGLDCDDKNPCTDDSCDSSGACVHTNVGDGTLCNDGDACTSADSCLAGKCAGAALSCDDGNECTTDSCDAASGCVNAASADGAACDDKSACTSGDTCQAGACKAGPAVECSPGDCQQGGVCDPVTGACSFSDKPDGAPCPGGVCNGGSCVEAGGAGGMSGSAGQGGAGQAGAGQAGAGQAGAGQAGAGQAGVAGKGGAGGAGAAGVAGKGGAAGAAGKGGAAGQGGAGAAGKGGAGGAVAGAAGSGSAVEGVSQDDGGCGCRTSGAPTRAPAGLLLAGLLALGARRRRAAQAR